MSENRFIPEFDILEDRDTPSTLNMLPVVTTPSILNQGVSDIQSIQTNTIVSIQTISDKPSVAPGDTFTVTISANTIGGVGPQPNNIMGLGFQLVYDAQQVQFVSAAALKTDNLLGIRNGGRYGSNEVTNVITVAWYEINGNTTIDGSLLLTATFQALPGFTGANFWLTQVSIPANINYSASTVNVTLTGSNIQPQPPELVLGIDYDVAAFFVQQNKKTPGSF